MALVLSKIIVKPKNSVIKTRKARTVLYNIETGEVYNNNWSLSEYPDWIEEIDRRWTMFHNDVMLIEFIEDLNDPVGEYEDTMTVDLIREDCIGLFEHFYSMIWDSVKDKYIEDLNDRDVDGISKRYIIDMTLRSWQCYEGDWDVDGEINRILECNGSSFNEIELVGVD